MNSRERVHLALNHIEADRVPLDIGGTRMSQIHKDAYRRLRKHLALPDGEKKVRFVGEQLAEFETDIADRLESDMVCIFPEPPADYELQFRDEGDYETFTDEWGLGYRKPKFGGYYYDLYLHPLEKAESLEDLRAYPFPDPTDENLYKFLRPVAQEAHERGKAVNLGAASAGILEMYAWMRGYQQFYIDLALNHDFVGYMLDRLVEFKQAYWERALAELGDLVTVVCEQDDLAGQNRLLFSPEIYRKIIQPRHKKLFAFIKQQAPVKLFYHTDGAVRTLIWDLIESGIDILNPVQYTLKDMGLRELKREYGRDLIFWGGGVDTQGVLEFGTPEEVRAEVRRNIEALAPGGGFIFATVHNIQANVPAENIIAMWDSWKEFGVY